MAKRKLKPVRRIRRSPYERSLEHATQRLDKALTEQLDCQAKLEALNREIPYLQGVIRALTPVEQAIETSPGVYRRQVAGSEVSKLGSVTVKVIPDHLKRFIKPVDNGIVVDQSEPFIPDIIPGEELLP